jgi:hypothetical protein
MNLPNDSLYK